MNSALWSEPLSPSLYKPGKECEWRERSEKSHDEEPSGLCCSFGRPDLGGYGRGAEPADLILAGVTLGVIAGALAWVLCDR
jgi:hypothetical protein